MAIIINIVKKIFQWNETVPPPLFTTVDATTKEIIKTALRNNEHPSMHLDHLNYGVGYDLRYEYVLRRCLKTMKIEQLAEYCDLVIRSTSDDVEFSPKYFSDFETYANDELKQFCDDNFTTLANFAWLSLHAPHENERNLFCNFVESYLDMQRTTWRCKRHATWRCKRHAT